MSKNGIHVKSGLADPSRLKPFTEDDDDTITVVIETPKGSRNKYAFDEDQRAFKLKEVLPAGMAFCIKVESGPTSTLAAYRPKLDSIVSQA